MQTVERKIIRMKKNHVKKSSVLLLLKSIGSLQHHRRRL